MAESVKDKVAIIGMGCTKFGELWNKSSSDLMVDAAYEAYEDAGGRAQGYRRGLGGELAGGERNGRAGPGRPSAPV